MNIIKSVSGLNSYVELCQREQKQIGFVPTMGALHSGHLQLVKRAVSENDVCIVSIFVNPTQFNDKGDLERYPRVLEKDAAMLEAEGCAVVFAPSSDEMYSSSETNAPFEFDFGGLDMVMEGKFRAHHFNGVVQVVSKLFTIVQPDRAYFGEKDFQQLAIIRRMVELMCFAVEIVGCPIVREESGLAMSSRNELLSFEERELASNISKVLKESCQFALQTTVSELKEAVVAAINRHDGLEVEYFDIVDTVSLKSIDEFGDAQSVVACIAVYCGKVRLIDNILYK